MSHSLQHLRTAALLASCLAAGLIAVGVEQLRRKAIHSADRESAAQLPVAHVTDAPLMEPMQLELSAIQRTVLIDPAELQDDLVLTAAPPTDDAPIGHASFAIFEEGTAVGKKPTVADEIARLMATGDAALRASNISLATRSYEKAAQLHSETPLPDLLFRQGLASESAGAYSRALEFFREVREVAGPSLWTGVAMLGEVRCWTALGRLDLVQSAGLQRALVDTPFLTPGLQQELLQCCTLALAGDAQSLAMSPLDLVNDARFLTPPLHGESIHHLDRLEDWQAQPVIRKPVPGIRLIRPSVQGVKDSSVQACMEDIRLDDLLRILLEVCGTSCKFSPQAAEVVQAHRATLCTTQIGLPVALDALCGPQGLLWLENDGVIHILRNSECARDLQATCQLQSLERLLRATAVICREHPQKYANQLALGVNQAEQHLYPAAAAAFQEVINNSRDTALRSIAAWNLGKCHVHQGDPDRALEAFLLAVDARTDDSLLRAAAHLYVARLHLELLDSRSAISPAMRAAALCDGSPLEAWAVEVLASAYLVAGNPHAANHVLMKYRSTPATAEAADRLAFLAALARLDATVLADRREHEAQSLLEAVSHVRADTCFGEHWWLLIGRSYREIGFLEAAASTYRQALRSNLSPALHAEVRHRLSEVDPQMYHLAHDGSAVRNDNARDLAEIDWASGLHLAERALLRDDAPSALIECRKVLADCSNASVRREAVRLMGQAFQQLGDYPSAIHCFSGDYLEVTGPGVPSSTEGGN